MRESFLSFLLDFIAPPRQTQALVRTVSLKTLQTLALRGTQKGILPYHDERVRALVWEVKYYANKKAVALAAEILHENLLSIAAEHVGTPLLIPVPMHTARKRARGHNQAETICKATLPLLAGSFDYTPCVLVRTTQTHSQQGLERQQRLTNVRHSMEVLEPEKVRGRVCIVVDDVCTTGATFVEAARALNAAGARYIDCIALAQS